MGAVCSQAFHRPHGQYISWARSENLSQRVIIIRPRRGGAVTVLFSRRGDSIGSLPICPTSVRHCQLEILFLSSAFPTVADVFRHPLAALQLLAIYPLNMDAGVHQCPLRPLDLLYDHCTCPSAWLAVRPGYQRQGPRPEEPASSSAG